MSHSLAKNRAYWNLTSDAYQASHGGVLGRTPMAWGVWRIPESTLGVLGDVAGLRVLELGCGAAQWSHALAGLGARIVGIDLSEQQLAHARVPAESTRDRAALVQGNAVSLPFGAATFDVVFSDHGAPVFAPPDAIVAEVARVLRPNGLFAFCMASPLLDVCLDANADTVSARLATDYFGLSTVDDGQSVTYQLPYGDWIRLFRRHALVVEDLIELRPPENAETTYADFVPLDWARRWPAEHIWKVRKDPGLPH